MVDARDDVEWASDRRPGKKPRIADHDHDMDDDYYREGGGGGNGPSASAGASAGREYDRFERRYEQERSPPPMLPPPPPSSGGDAAGRGARLLLANLSYNTTEEEIVDFFRDAGAEVERVRLVKVTPGNRVNGNAYMWLADERSVDVALEMDGREFVGRTLRVSRMPEHQRTACVRGLRPRSTPKDVEELFEGCRISGVRGKPVKGGPPDMNTWFVDFADEESFSRALAKDRSLPGLMICIATAQGRGSSSASVSAGANWGRERVRGRDEVEDRGGRADKRVEERRFEERRAEERRFEERRTEERRTEEMDREDLYERKRGFGDDDRMVGKGKNGVGSSSSIPRGRGRSRSPSPLPRLFDRKPSGVRSQDRYGESDRVQTDRRDYDRYAERMDDRDRDLRKSPGRDDRYRWGRDYDRGRDRDMDRRDYRRDYEGGWMDRNRDFRRDRDYDRERDYDRDRRASGRAGRSDRDYQDSRYAEPRDKLHHPAKPLDPIVTAVLTNLPFCENRERVIDTLGRTLEELPGDLKIAEIVPVGRRCGAAVVVFRDEQSHDRALGLQSITINTRKVNILPLEVPSVARVQKLTPGYSVEMILEDMQRRYDVDSMFVKLKQSDQLLLGVEDTRFLVRLLDIDGRPLVASRYATISYIPSRHYYDSVAARGRRPPDEYDDPNGRRGGSSRDRDARDDRDGFGKDRRRDGDSDRGDLRGEKDDSRSGDSRSHHRNGGEWKLRISGIPTMMEESELMARFSDAGFTGLIVEKTGANHGLVLGGDTNEEVMKKILALCNFQDKDSALDGVVSGAEVVKEGKKRNSIDAGINGNDPSEISPKRAKRSPDEHLKAKAGLTPVGSTPSRPFHISPMTPSPNDHAIPSKGKRGPVSPDLTETCKRLERLRSAILDRVEEVEKDSYEDFCRSLHSLREPQKLIYTLSRNIDPKPPQIWSGNVRQGSKPFAALCNGYLVLNSRHSEKEVQHAITIMPNEIKIEHRGKWDDEAFGHLVRPESVVTILKAVKQEKNAARGVDERGKMVPRSNELLNGIVESLRGRQKMGITRYTITGLRKRYVALCLPPSPCIFEKLRMPWRFRDYTGHNSLLLIAGPRKYG